MKLTQTLCALLAVLAGSSLLLADGSVAWQTDHTAALAEAKASGRYLLLDFTGSTWCPPCKALNAEVINQEPFAKLLAEKNVVALKLDFPRARDERPAAMVAVARQYEIEGFPTVIVLDPAGKEVFREVGFSAGGGEEFLTKLAAALK